MTRPAGGRRRAVRGGRRKDESGASAVELVLYMPILMFTILFAVQFCLIYLGAQVASGAAREAARTARVTGSGPAGQAAGERVIGDIGSGVLTEAQVSSQVAGNQARVVVTGHASKILPFLPVPQISETVEGPIERFVPDNGATP